MIDLVLPWWWRWAALGALAVICMGFGAFKMHEHDQKAYNELAREFGEFKGKVAALGEKAEADAIAQQAKDKKRKEDADAENSASLAALADSVGRLRNERDRARSRILPSRPPASKCPDGQACFDATQLERALRDYRSAIRGLVDEGSAVTVDLDTAKRWANSPAPQEASSPRR